MERGEAFLKKLKALAGEDNIKVHEPMSRHTTFRIGGPADYFVSPGDEKSLRQVLACCRGEGMPCYILGKGSNLLVSDSGWRGVIISTEKICQWKREGTVLEAGAGISLARLAKLACAHSLEGLEFAAGIPGTLGGAVVMNAGAYGSEMKEVLISARVLDGDGLVRELSAEELELGYRVSCILRKGYVVLSAEIKLREGSQEQIQAKMDGLALQRRTKQPLEYPSAGSMFKRPAGYFAGKLIDEAGLRGFAVGDAQVSEKHCGFVINRGDATARDVLELCREVSRIVKEKTGVTLEREVKYLE